MWGLPPWARYGLLVGAHLLVLGFGAVVLQILEGPPALKLQTQLRAELAAFQAQHGACLPPGALEELLGTALMAQAHGVSGLANGSEAETWDLPSALLFTASILTTAGKAAQRPRLLGGGGFWGYSLFLSPKVPDRSEASSGLTSLMGLPTPNTPQLVSPLQLPTGVWSP